MDILIKTAQLILSLSILVILHEFGHFFFARLFNTKVEKFYLFFDPWFSLFKFKKGDTEYGIGWIPLGGYVKISGMIDESMDKEAMKLPPKPWEFRSKTAVQRLLIMIGGVVVNFIAAIVIYWLLLFQYGESYIPVSNAKFGLYYNEQLQGLGLQDGDVILKADTFTIVTTHDITTAILLDQATNLTVQRGDSVFTLDVPADFIKKILEAEVKVLSDFRVPVVIDTVVPGFGAANSGLLKGDSVVSVDGVPAAWFHQFVKTLGDKAGKEVTLAIYRDTLPMELKCLVSDKGKIGIGNRNYFTSSDVKTQEYGFFAALPAGVSKGVTTLTDYMKQLPLIFSKEGAKQIGGFGSMGNLFPAEWNWRAFWELTALLSVILAFMNILPIPALDGGHVLFLLYEIITGRKPSDKFLEYAQVFGMVLLLSLLLFANGNDIFRAILGK